MENKSLRFYELTEHGTADFSYDWKLLDVDGLEAKSENQFVCSGSVFHQTHLPHRRNTCLFTITDWFNYSIYGETRMTTWFWMEFHWKTCRISFAIQYYAKCKFCKFSSTPIRNRIESIIVYAFNYFELFLVPVNWNDINGTKRTWNMFFEHKVICQIIWNIFENIL